MSQARIITSRRVVSKGKVQKLGILVEDGKIADVLHSAQIPDHVPVVDYGDQVIMPGLIDAHVHINEPGRADWEGFETATRAAAAGGVTTLVDMPLNSSPVTTSIKALKQKQQAAREKQVVDCLFYGGLVPGKEDQIEPLLEAGVVGIKAFLCDSGINEFPPVTEAGLRKAMPVLARHGKPLLVHAELTDTENAPEVTKPDSYEQYLHSRPAQWEADAINLLTGLSRETGCWVHIVHLSAALGLLTLRKAQSEGVPVTVETTPHYLFFCSDEIPDGDPRFKCAPPIRDAANRDLLHAAIVDGAIDLVATDHSPCPPELKELRSGDLTKAWGGISSLQLMLPVLWTALQKRNISPVDIARLTAENPARLIGQDHLKGRIEPGYEANLTVWDPDKSFHVQGARLYHRHKITPYEGQQLQGVVTATWLRGEQVYPFES